MFLPLNQDTHKIPSSSQNYHPIYNSMMGELCWTLIENIDENTHDNPYDRVVTMKQYHSTIIMKRKLSTPLLSRDKAGFRLQPPIIIASLDFSNTTLTAIIKSWKKMYNNFGVFHNLHYRCFPLYLISLWVCLWVVCVCMCVQVCLPECVACEARGWLQVPSCITHHS